MTIGDRPGELPGDEESGARRLGAALGRIDALRRHRPGFADLGSADMRLLWLMIQSGPQTLAEITDALSLERSTVNRQVNAAVNDGLLIKERIPGSAAYQVTLSPEGRAAFDRSAQRALDNIDAVLEQMGPEKSGQLISLIEEFVDVYGVRLESTQASATQAPSVESRGS